MAESTITNTNFTTTISTQAVDQVDLLFMIDNSASMGDKQYYLSQAVPDLVTRLISPNCLDSSGNVLTNPTTGAALTADESGNCTSGGTAEFPPVHDLHIGIVTSSLGDRGTLDLSPDAGMGNAPLYVGASGPVCPASALVTENGIPVNRHNDDQGHLINRVPDAGLPNNDALSVNPPTSPLLTNGGTTTFSDNFLAWLPAVAGNANKPDAAVTALTDGGALNVDFTELIAGVDQFGCGIESQLESWYRFLIQPDPYQSIAVTQSAAAWNGVDYVILQQRKDFLRPGSLLAVIVLTDENDSEIDVRANNGLGWLFLQGQTPVMRATSACTLSDAGPADPNCTSCFYATDASAFGQQVLNDPYCQIPGQPINGIIYNGQYQFTQGDDVNNIRHVHMKERFGFDPQYPIQRYVNGLTALNIPDRVGEYPTPNGYVGNPNCVNPLFASALPDPSSATFQAIVADAGSFTTTLPASLEAALCQLPTNSLTQRSPSLIFFAHIGGVPYDLVSSIDGGAITPKATLATSDWKAILGNNPANFDYTGIDSRMMETIAAPLIDSGAYATEFANVRNFGTNWIGPRNGALAARWGATNANYIADLNGNIDGGVAVVDDYTNAQGNFVMGNHYGREWDSTNWTNPVLDLNYACTFPLPTTPINQQRDCTTVENNSTICDCPIGSGCVPSPLTNNADAGGCPITGPYPPLCGTSSPNNAPTGPITTQTRAKAYPTIRELQVAQALGTQAVVSSICPIHTVDQSASGHTDPLYGYRPAVAAIIDRLKSALSKQCLPQALTADSTGQVPCLVLVTLNTPGPQSTCTTQGFKLPDPTIEAQYRAQNLAATSVSIDGGPSQNLPVCQIQQKAVTAGSTCVDDTAPEFCYVQNVGTQTPAGSCGFALTFTASAVPAGAITSLQCINASTGSSTDSGTGG